MAREDHYMGIFQIALQTCFCRKNGRAQSPAWLDRPWFNRPKFNREMHIMARIYAGYDHFLRYVENTSLIHIQKWSAS
jgi:hypothetical protein